MVRVALLLPPDLHDAAGLIARDLLREGVEAALRRRAAELEAEGTSVLRDTGDRGRTAAETARAVREAGCEAVELFVPITHRRTARRLAQALRDQKLAFEERTFARVADGVPSGLAVLPLTPDERFFDAVGDRPLALGPTAPEPVRDASASPLSPALHLGGAWLDRIERFVVERRPAVWARWRWLRIQHEAAVSPREAVYAGLHLRDRNDDLLAVLR